VRREEEGLGRQEDRQPAPARGFLGGSVSVSASQRAGQEVDAEAGEETRQGQGAGRAGRQAQSRASVPSAITHATPEALYERGWALTLLEQGLTRLREEWAGAGKQQLFECFRLRAARTCCPRRRSTSSAKRCAFTRRSPRWRAEVCERIYGPRRPP